MVRILWDKEKYSALYIMDIWVMEFFFYAREHKIQDKDYKFALMDIWEKYYLF
jgi:hypothetical protein